MTGFFLFSHSESWKINVSIQEKQVFGETELNKKKINETIHWNEHVLKNNTLSVLHYYQNGCVSILIFTDLIKVIQELNGIIFPRSSNENLMLKFTTAQRDFV